VDLDRPETLGPACAEIDLVVTTVRHPGHPLERRVLREGGALLSVASLSAADRADLKAAETDSRGLVVLHAGVHPGVGTLILKEMLTEHPQAEGLELAVVFSFVQSSERGSVVDFMYPALTSAPRHPTRSVDFDEPIGRRRCMDVSTTDSGFFGELADNRSARLEVACLQRAAQAEFLSLNALGLWRALPRVFFTLGSGWRSRRPTSVEPRRDLLTVTRAGTPIATCTLRGAGDYRMTPPQRRCSARPCSPGERTRRKAQACSARRNCSTSTICESSSPGEASRSCRSAEVASRYRWPHAALWRRNDARPSWAGPRQSVIEHVRVATYE
jgi:hypothetical protein